MTLPEILGTVYTAGGIFEVRGDHLIIKEVTQELPSNVIFAIKHRKSDLIRLVNAFGGRWPKKS